jgi:hypothetical protein
MWNEQINGLAINHSSAPLPEQEWMWILDAKEMESSSKINLKGVSWKMSIKNAYKHGVLVIAKLSKKWCIFLITKGRLSQTAQRHN